MIARSCLGGSSHRDSVTSSERQRHASSDSRAGDRHDGNPREASSKSGFRGGDANVTSPGPHTVPRIGGELEFEAWKGGVRPAFVLVDLGLTQRNGNYASGTIFQAVLAEEVRGFKKSSRWRQYRFEMGTVYFVPVTTCGYVLMCVPGTVVCVRVCL